MRAFVVDRTYYFCYNPNNEKKDQKIVFPQLLGHGTPIYIMFEADKENYASLFRECNCPHYIAMKGY